MFRLMSAPLAVIAAALAGALLAAEAGLAFVAADVSDHATGAGRASEALFACALVATLVALRGVHERQAGVGRGERATYAAAMLGVGLAAIATASVIVTGKEPVAWLAAPAILGLLLGPLAFGVATWRVRAWPRWTAAFIGGWVLVVFFGDAAGALLAALGWIAIARTIQATPRPSVALPAA